MTTTNNIMNSFISESNISFNGGDLSSDTGSILPVEFMISNNLLQTFDDLPYTDTRSTVKSYNSNESIFAQLIVRYLCGYFSQSDQSVFENDPIFSRIFNGISSQSAISRFFGRISEETVEAFWKKFMDQSCTFVSENLKDILLDADSTKTDTYGEQEDAAYIHHYDQVGYHPFVINEYATKMLVGAWLRPGNTFSAAEADCLLAEVLNRIPDITPDGSVRTIKFRGDAAFSCDDLMVSLENRDNPVLYAIRAKGTSALERSCQASYEADENRKEDALYTSREPYYGEIRYQMCQSEVTRRVCFKLYYTEELDKQGLICLIPHIFAVFTNIVDLGAEEVINFYCQRGNSENFTKELKDSFGANTLSHKKFYANAFEFLLKSLAYNIFHMFQYLIMEGTDRKMVASTFRKKYQKIAARLSSHARRFYLSIARSFRYKQEFRRYLHRAKTVSWIPTHQQ